MGKKVLIVGGVAGGASAAARLRRVDETAEIILFEKGEYISFANCGLPYYIGETIEERSALLVQTPEDMKKRFNIDVRVQNEVLSINREKKSIEVINLASGQKYEESYDVLVLSPGSTPLKPPIPGINNPNIFTLWNIPDTDAIKGFVDNLKPKRAAVIGGGFIGLEMAENLWDRGIQVSVIEMLDQVMAPIDFEMAQQVHAHLRQKGVDLRLSDGVKEFDYNNGVTTVTLASGAKVDAEIVLLSIGVRPQTQLAKDAGLELNERGGIVVDSTLKTSDPNIYAIGDAVEVMDFVQGIKAMVPLAGPANKQGRIAANNIAGASEEYKGTQGTSIAKVFDLTVANTGVNEKSLKRAGKAYGVDYWTSIIHSKSHAGYYPGALPMAFKLIFDNKGKVLGAQIVGHDGVDKRIDVIATAIRFGGTIEDLKELELAYAPPYSSAKDPVNMAGFTAENILKGDLNVIQWHEIEGLDSEKSVIVDVRDPVERELGYVGGSINIPVDDLRARHGELDKSKTIVVYCAVGLRGYIAARILKQLGFEDVRNLSGGFSTFQNVYCQDPANLEKCGGTIISGTEGVMIDDMEISDSGEVVSKAVKETGNVIKLNACGLQCPGPILQVFKKMEELEPGDVLEVTATDPGFVNDIATWAKKTGNTLMSSGKGDKKNVFATVMKGTVERKPAQHLAEMPNDKTLVVFSGDLDKALAALIIANGAAAMGRKVTMFYTFWGLNILKKSNPPSVSKDFMSKMFGAMLPKGVDKLGLSKMHMFGMGPAMMKKIMKDKNVDSLDTLLKQALENNVRMIACTMSMDVLGVEKEELIDGIEYSGVATYLGAAEEADVNLFI
ncbi:FAD-dependent oxidoreductase [Acidaminobacter hydrogenoformans]|uniref:NADPH-dependent 2,4-dienoyl-CoA reductase, sulfur reductase n=1 Tax=Acidaminobacter hydrogenoformans DSM 2784 TaxID=1120920 RepID=A0A1G5RZ26_9FIRM|nr:FAD-dependent oxidoreductase [Acidaminobacter hydrogenoformans]SCZ79187.1 NADPH-dependent 2,4-dienoyl-CoA reductase, sulfur reductase [Acidaminobacter hydrogenoformans DSM 2784]